MPYIGKFEKFKFRSFFDEVGRPHRGSVFSLFGMKNFSFGKILENISTFGGLYLKIDLGYRPKNIFQISKFQIFIPLYDFDTKFSGMPENAD
ncbi:MAG TPA: hypothetical protein EYO61_03555 [Campylobacterales bacterium]|nr:hypothetical protein [Campylobacterales bacterium]